MTEWTPLQTAEAALKAARTRLDGMPDDLRTAEVAAQVAQAQALTRIADRYDGKADEPVGASS